MISPHDVDALMVFVKVAEHGSLSAAGRALGLPKATVSRRLADLEAALGTSLLRRTTRSQSLTDAGRILLGRTAPLVADAEAAMSEIRALSAEPSGLLRITAAITFGQIVLLPIVAKFLAQNAKVRIELELSDSRAPVVGGGFDIAVRMGLIEDSELIARRLMRVPLRLVASADYLAAAGTPRSVEQLRQHTGLLSDPKRDVWRFERDGVPAEVRVSWRFATGGMMALRDACAAGLGIAVLPSIVADSFVEEGRLVQLDVGSDLIAADASALYVRNPSLAAKRLVEFMVAELKGR